MRKYDERSIDAPVTSWASVRNYLENKHNRLDEGNQIRWEIWRRKTNDITVMEKNGMNKSQKSSVRSNIIKCCGTSRSDFKETMKPNWIIETKIRKEKILLDIPAANDKRSENMETITRKREKINQKMIQEMQHKRLWELLVKAIPLVLEIRKTHKHKFSEMVGCYRTRDFSYWWERPRETET